MSLKWHTKLYDISIPSFYFPSLYEPISKISTELHVVLLRNKGKIEILGSSVLCICLVVGRPGQTVEVRRLKGVRSLEMSISS